MQKVRYHTFLKVSFASYISNEIILNKMGPKKKAAKKDAGDDDEYNGPNLYLEFASKNPVEIAIDMKQPKERM